MNYPEALAYVSGLEGRGWRLGLDRMQAFVAEAGLENVLGGPGSPIQYLHVAGTNGKGSVTAYLQHALYAQGYRVGAYFSPYVVDPRERIQIGLDLISPDEFAAVATELRAVAERLEERGEQVTEFEFKTAMGFLAWKRGGVEVVALEVGLGGRLDATNVVTPKVSAIVSISLDHTSILGDTEAAIAREKAGIIKPGVPCVLGPVGAEAEEAIRAIAEERSSPLVLSEAAYQADPRTRAMAIGVTLDGPGCYPGIHGRHQYFNARLAVVTLAEGGYLGGTADVCRGLRETRLPGRMEQVRLEGHDILVDGAHNPDSARVLALSLGPPPITAIVGMVAGHDPDGFFSAEALGIVRAQRWGSFDRIFAVPVDNPRSLDPELVAQAARRQGMSAETFGSLRAAMAHVGSLKLRMNERLVVTGSLYLAGEAIRAASDGSQPDVRERS